MYDTVSQIKSPFTTHVAPNTSTNLTMSFSNQLNTVHNQVNDFNSNLSWVETIRAQGEVKKPVCALVVLLCKNFQTDNTYQSFADKN